MLLNNYFIVQVTTHHGRIIYLGQDALKETHEKSSVHCLQLLKLLF